jgi:hypothetical protein
MKPLPKRIQCPTCKKAGDWFATPHGPFCSPRCKLIDLGRWLGEEHRISEPLRGDLFEQYADLPPGEYLDHPEPEAAPEKSGNKRAD